jgi:hypothetical protein
MRRWIPIMAFYIVISNSCYFLPAQTAASGEIGQSPTLMIKIRNIEQLLNDIGKLMPPTPGSQAGQPMDAVRGMLQGGDWIDPQRSVVIGMFSQGARTNLVAIFPFRAANMLFEKALNATVRKDYYLMNVPPQPGFVISPAAEESLSKASMAPSAGSLVVKISADKFLAMVEPQMAAVYKGMAAGSQPGQTSLPPGISAQDIQATMTDMLKTLKQAETLRLGMDISGNVLTLQYDIDALPNTLLAGVLTDPGDDTRLMDYPIEMPIQFRARAHNTSDMANLAGMSFGRIYRQLGLNLDDMKEINKDLTGETAGGLKVTSNGLELESISVLQPGISGEDFLQNKYLPYLERYNPQISNLAAQQTGLPPAQIYERTADSLVAGIKVLGVKAKLNVINPPGEKKTGIFDKQVFEMRMAAVGNLVLIASDDAKMESLINKSRGLSPTPAHGPMLRLDMKLGAFLSEVMSLLPSGGTPAVWPDDFGNLTMQAEMNNGKLAARISFNIDEMKKLTSFFNAQAVKK